MESEKFLNPRLFSINSSGNKAMRNELPQKRPPPSSLLDRFKDLLYQRHDELEDLVTEEIVELYELFLADLTFNSKPIITDLTIIAGEQREHADGIVDAICARILEAPIEQKLPSLYLVDSIVKNIGREYIRHFSSRLPEVFCEAFRQVPPNMYSAMRHLFGTWSAVFPPAVLRKIETHLKLSSSASKKPSLAASDPPLPARGIHVNPKYLPRLEPSCKENNMRGVRAAIGGNKVLPSAMSRVVRPVLASSRRLTSEVDEFAPESSPGRFSDGSSSSNPSLDYQLGRGVSRGSDTTEWRRKYVQSSRQDHQIPRALIEAYGVDPSKQASYILLHSDRINMDGMHNKVGVKSWQKSEEDEFDWEDMSPALNHGSTGVIPPTVPSFSDVHFSSSSGKALVPQFSRGSSLASRMGSSGVDCVFDAIKLQQSGTWSASDVRGSHLLMPPVHLHQLRASDLNQQNGMHINTLQPSSAMSPRPLQPLASVLSCGYPSQGSSIRPPPVSGHKLANNSFHSGALPPLPFGHPSQIGSVSQNAPSNQAPGSGFSGLIGSLMAQGLISLTNQPSAQGALGIEFDVDLIKVRHESAVSALYTDLPRQCTTCGTRFSAKKSTAATWIGM